MLRKTIRSNRHGPVSIAVLVSGGVESAAMLMRLSADRLVQPIYVRGGHTWERAELYWLRRLLRKFHSRKLLPLAVLDVPVRDLYRRATWSLSGRGVPGSSTRDEAVYLPGRNILLLAKAAVYCAEHGIPRIALGTLGSNPFPDASAGFHKRFAKVLSEGLAKRIAIERPLAHLRKEQILRKTPGVPWRLTFSCISPQDLLHCGRCNKCSERQKAFRLAGLDDPTR